MTRDIPVKGQGSVSTSAILFQRELEFSFRQGSVLGPLLFLAYVNDIWRNMESTIRLYADDCVIYRKIINNEDVDKLQKDLEEYGLNY